MHGGRPAVLQGGAADGGGPVRAGVGTHQAAVWDRAGSQREAARCARTTTGAARTSAADPGETACVSAGPAGGGVTEEPAQCSHQLRATQLGSPSRATPKTDGSKSTTTELSRRYGRSCLAA